MDFLDKRIAIPLSNRTTTVKYARVHTAYWVFITGFFLYERRYLIYKAGLQYFAACVIIRVSLLIVIAYINIHYLLPRYLLPSRYGRYFSLVLLSILGYLLINLSKMMEYMLYDSDDARVPLEKEIGYLQNYIELEKIRCGDHSDIALHINGHPNGQEIDRLLLLPHLSMGQADKAWLHGTLNLNPTAGEMTVENNKPKSRPESHKEGIGLTNLRKRLELLYPGRYTLQTEDRLDTYRAALYISLAE